MVRQVRLGLIGAGNRGRGIFGQYALDMPHRAVFTMVVEPDDAKRKQFAAQHDLPANRCFGTIDAAFEAEVPDLDGVIIATLEDQRLDPIFRAMERDWHILTEKPLCTNAEDLIRLYDRALDYRRILIVSHQMRLAPVFRTLKELIDSERYGRAICIQHSENLSYSHMAHSFVRGFFNNSRLTPMLLAKSCHDMDIVVHLVGRKVSKVSSFGSLTHFRRENCPPGAPAFCLEGCPHSHRCPYDTKKLYFNDDTDPAFLRQMGVVRDKHHLRELLMTNRFGRCVFQTDNDVVDHQVVQVEFEDGTTSSFTMCGHNGVERRMMKVSLTNGELEYNGRETGRIRTWSFEPLRDELITVQARGTHGGGDRAIMDNFCDAIVNDDRSSLLTPIRDSLEGHLLVFAAEESRRTGRVIALRDFEEQTRRAVQATP